MTESRRAWNAWDAPYFGAVPRDRAEPGDPEPVGSPDLSVLSLAGAGAGTGERVWAVLLGIGGVLGGAALAGMLLFASFVLSFGSPPDGSDLLMACLFGGAVAVGGLVLAVLTYRHAGRPVHLRLDDDSLEVAYKAFKAPLVIPREMIRAVAIDDTPALFFTNNKRFPIAGVVPAHVFADALDNLPAGPWDDLDPERRDRRLPSPAVIDEDMPGSSREPGGYPHDEPGRAGWGSAGRPAPTFEAPQDAYLWSAAGSSLPFLRLGPGDVPNLAVLFHGPVRTPRAPWWFELSPIHGKRPFFRGGRAVRGVLLRVRDGSAAEAAFRGWGVLRPITSEDVVDEGLLVAKPLAGIRAVAYGALVVGPILVEVLLRALR